MRPSCLRSPRSSFRPEMPYGNHVPSYLLGLSSVLALHPKPIGFALVEIAAPSAVGAIGAWLVYLWQAKISNYYERVLGAATYPCPRHPQEVCRQKLVRLTSACFRKVTLPFVAMEHSGARANLINSKEAKHEHSSSNRAALITVPPRASEPSPAVRFGSSPIDGPSRWLGISPHEPIPESGRPRQTDCRGLP